MIVNSQKMQMHESLGRALYGRHHVLNVNKLFTRLALRFSTHHLCLINLLPVIKRYHFDSCCHTNQHSIV